MGDGIIEYLAHMLTSFTKINSYVVPVRVRPGVRRRIRYNDMDVDSLIALCEKAGDHERFAFYKAHRRRVPLHVGGLSGLRPPPLWVHASRPLDAFAGTAPSRTTKRKGAVFTASPEEHPAARLMDLTDIFSLLREKLHLRPQAPSPSSPHATSTPSATTSSAPSEA